MHELNILSENVTLINIYHVKGHQDSEKQRNLTPVEALNVEADKLAHEARQLPHIKTYSPFPTNKVNLVLNKRYIKSPYPKMVKLAFHSMALREHYASKYRWTSQIIDAIWWPIYYQSLSRLQDSDKLRIKKFFNNRWPTLQRERKYYKLYSETEYHIIRCRVPSRQKI
jgi:hypothetical protein